MQGIEALVLVRKQNKRIFEPAHEIIVLISQAISEGSDESALVRSLARAFAVNTHKVGK